VIPGRRILVIEDDESVRRTLGIALTNAGYGYPGITSGLGWQATPLIMQAVLGD
jgi:DNA-binding response OmpR family regulator